MLLGETISTKDTVGAKSVREEGMEVHAPKKPSNIIPIVRILQAEVDIGFTMGQGWTVGVLTMI